MVRCTHRMPHLLVQAEPNAAAATTAAVSLRFPQPQPTSFFFLRGACCTKRMSAGSRSSGRSRGRPAEGRPAVPPAATAKVRTGVRWARLRQVDSSMGSATGRPAATTVKKVVGREALGG